MEEVRAELTSTVIEDQTAADSTHLFRKLIVDNRELMSLFAELMDQSEISFDTETTGTDWRYHVIVGASMSWGPPGSEKAIYVPFAHRNTLAQCSAPVVNFFLEGILRNPSIRKFMHNAKFEYHMLMTTFGWLPVDPIDDTLIMAFIVDNDAPLGLKAQAAMYFDTTALREEESLKLHIKNNRLRCYGEVSAERMSSYALSDAVYTLKLGRLHSEEIQKNFAGIYSTERELIWTTYRMERQGMPIDAEYFKSQYPAIDARIPVVQAILDDQAWAGFNPRSTRDVRALLFDKLNLPVIKRTDKGAAATNESVLLNLRHPIIPIILEARTLTKARKVYITNLVNAAAWDGRIHTKFNQTGAGTGRFSSSGIGGASINLQNIPREGSLPFSVRSGFVPDPGCLLVFMDYVQVEMMWFAFYSRDPALIKAARSGFDFHLATAVDIFDKPIGQISKPERKWAKRVNFGILYGEGRAKLALELEITEREAGKFMKRYFGKYPGVQTFMERERHEYERLGYVLNIFGRRRRIPFDKAYRAVNTKIQGSAADTIKHAMKKVDRYISHTHIKLLSTIHDELYFMWPINELWCIPHVKALMEDFHLDVPIRVDVEWSDLNWGHKRPISELIIDRVSAGPRFQPKIFKPYEQTVLVKAVS